MSVLIKICGLSTGATMQVALDAGADYVGLVFFKKSPRNVSLKQARDLAEQARGRARVVALLVNPTDDDVDMVLDTVRPDLIQLHGAESVDRVAELQQRGAAFGDVGIIKALKISTAEDLNPIEPFRQSADAVLFDAKPPPGAALPGGNGVPFDWRLLDGMAKRHFYLLSGGLNPENVAQAIALTGAPAVDVSSGVETVPGIKDPALIKRFIANASDAGSQAKNGSHV